MDQNERVAKYYEDTQQWYNFFWGINGIHFGIWDEGTTSHNESVQNTNEFAAQLLGVNVGDRVLDAGCGIGATARFIAEQYQAHVTGITIADNQVEEARSSTPPNLKDLVTFVNRDFEATGFNDNSFDGVYAIESICHGDPARFIVEAYRLLDKGGRIVVFDYSVAESLNKPDEAKYQIYVDGHQVPGILPVDEFKEHLENVGFNGIIHQDLSAQVARSFKRMRNLALAFGWILNPLSDRGFLSEDVANTSRGSKAMYDLFDSRVLTYSAYSAQK
jgi:tocopherol O-methyltransferase